MIIKNLIKSVLHAPSQWICKREFKIQKFSRINERPIEFEFVLKQIVKIWPRKILDVGSGTTALPHLLRNCGFLVTATDNRHDYWSWGMHNRHYFIIDDDITNTQLKDKFDLVTCISVLEHIVKHNEAITNIFKLLNPNGYLILTFPYHEKKYIENVYKLPGGGYGQNHKYICQVYSRNELDNWLRINNGIIVEQEYWQFWEGEFWTLGKQIKPPRKVGKNDRHQLSCILIQKNE